MKKLLAVLMSAAMVLGMTSMAFADAQVGEGVQAHPTLKVDGNKVSVMVEGEWNYVDSNLSWTEGAETEVKKYGGTLVDIADNEQHGNGVYDATVTGNSVRIACAYVATNGKDGAEKAEVPFTYTGSVFDITFSKATAENPVTVTLDGKSVTVPAAAEQSPSPTPSDETSPSPSPSAGTETASPSPSAGTDTASPSPSAGTTTVSPSPSVKPSTPAGTTSSTKPAGTTSSAKPAGTTGSTSAAKTADVAPIATLAVLALAAGVVVVSMKKKVTE